MVTRLISDPTTLLATMDPELHDGVYVYASVPADHDLTAVAFIAAVREREGTTVIVPEHEAQRAGLPVVFRAAWITLTVDSQLTDIGLTAAFAGVLGDAGISCNVVAGVHHDHIFVPVERAGDAMRALGAGDREAT